MNLLWATYPVWIYYDHKCNLFFLNVPNYWVLIPEHRIYCMLPHTTSRSIYSAFKRHILKWKLCTANSYMIGTLCGGSHVLPTVMWCILDCSFAFLHIHHWFKHMTKTDTSSVSFEEFVLCSCLNILQQTVTLTLPNLLTLHSVFHPKTSKWQI